MLDLIDNVFLLAWAHINFFVLHSNLQLKLRACLLVTLLPNLSRIHGSP